MSSPGMLTQCATDESICRVPRAAPLRSALQGNAVFAPMETDLSGGLRVFQPASPWADFAVRITTAPGGLIPFVIGRSWPLLLTAPDFAVEWNEAQFGQFVPAFLGVGPPIDNGLDPGNPIFGSGSGFSSVNQFPGSVTNMAVSGWWLQNLTFGVGGNTTTVAYRQRVWWSNVPFKSVHVVVVNVAAKQWSARDSLGSSFTLTDANVSVSSDQYVSPDSSGNILLESPFTGALPSTSDFTSTWPGTAAYNAAHPTAQIVSQSLTSDANLNCLILNGDFYVFLSNGNLLVLTGVVIQPGDNQYVNSTRTWP